MCAIAATAAALGDGVGGGNGGSDSDSVGGCADVHTRPGVLLGYVRRGGGRRGAPESAWSRTLRDAASAQGLRVVAEVAISARRASVLPSGTVSRRPTVPYRSVSPAAVAGAAAGAGASSGEDGDGDGATVERPSGCRTPPVAVRTRVATLSARG